MSFVLTICARTSKKVCLYLSWIDLISIHTSNLISTHGQYPVLNSYYGNITKLNKKWLVHVLHDFVPQKTSRFLSISKFLVWSNLILHWGLKAIQRGQLSSPINQFIYTRFIDVKAGRWRTSVTSYMFLWAASDELAWSTTCDRGLWKKSPHI